ncbi:MAG: hypothetical protein LBT47_04245 [Deltaproteobacteria bacterium]|jgi:hypothetical protein|nr:hypothetical protein [Deltaproteobacteria bacterium]
MKALSWTLFVSLLLLLTACDQSFDTPKDSAQQPVQINGSQVNELTKEPVEATLVEEVPQEEILSEGQKQLQYLQSLDYQNKENRINYYSLFQALETVIKDGYLEEADKEIKRITLASLTQEEKDFIGREDFDFGPILMERLGFLVENGYFDSIVVADSDFLPQGLSYKFFGSRYRVDVNKKDRHTTFLVDATYEF